MWSVIKPTEKVEISLQQLNRNRKQILFNPLCFSWSVSHFLSLHNIKAGNWYKIFLFLIKPVIHAYVRHWSFGKKEEKKKGLSKRITELRRTAAGHLCIACELPQVITEGTFTDRETDIALSALLKSKQNKNKNSTRTSSVKPRKTLPKWVWNKGTTLPPLGDVQNRRGVFFCVSLNATVAFLEMLQDLLNR